MSGPTTPALLADLAVEEASLDRVVADLDPDGWATPTPAEGWDVRDSSRTSPAAKTWPHRPSTTRPRSSVRRDEILAAGAATRCSGTGAPWPASRCATGGGLPAPTCSPSCGRRRGPRPVAGSRDRCRDVVRHRPAHGDLGPRPRRARPRSACRSRCRPGCVTSPTSGVRTRPFSYQNRGRPARRPVLVELDRPDGGVDVGRRRRRRAGRGPGGGLLPGRHPARQSRRQGARRHRAGRR